MEEKERYRLIGLDTSQGLVDKIYDTKKDIIIYSVGDADDVDNVIELLNQYDKRIKELEEELEEINAGSDFIYEQSGATIKGLIKENQQLKQQVEELKGKRLEFYNDDVRQTQVINGVHFDIEQLLVFSEYVEHEKNISADKDKQINQLKQQLAENEVKIANLEVLLSENANDRKAMQEFKIGEDEYDLTDEDARNSLCWEVEELKQQLLTFANRISDQNEEILELHNLPNKIVGEIKEQLFNHFNVKNIEEYEKLPLIDSLFTADTVIEILDTILKKYGGENESVCD